MSIKGLDDMINKEVAECVEQIYMRCTLDDDFWREVPLLVKLCCQKVLKRYLEADLQKMRDDLKKLHKEEM